MLQVLSINQKKYFEHAKTSGGTIQKYFVRNLLEDGFVQPKMNGKVSAK